MGDMLDGKLEDNVEEASKLLSKSVMNFDGL